jgi:hypothetical protein
MQRKGDYNPPLRVRGHQHGTPSRTIWPPVRNMINSRVPQLSCILYIIMYCHVQVLAVSTCVDYMCMESSGSVVAVYLTDTTPGCSSAAANYLVSKCGVGYTEISCNVDCSSIYAWNGGYWNAAGCNLLGNPCGPQGECPSSVLSVCQTPTPSSMATSTPSTIP